MSIEWKEGAVCFCGDSQWFLSVCEGQLFSECVSYGAYFGDLISNDNFQLNNIKQGDYIPKSELDTVDKYNRAVEVFGLFGFELGFNIDYIAANSYPYMVAASQEGGIGFCDKDIRFLRREITFNQLMAIGELKRLKDENATVCGKPKSEFVEAIKRVNELESSNDSKSLQAYEVLKSLDYEFDSEKGRWYRKEWV